MVPSLPTMAPTNQKSLPYPIYSAKTDLDAHVRVFQKAIQANGERNDVDIITYFASPKGMQFQNGGKISCNLTLDVHLQSWRQLFVNATKK
jgi:hypothetical protein